MAYAPDEGTLEQLRTFIRRTLYEEDESQDSSRSTDASSSGDSFSPNTNRPLQMSSLSPSQCKTTKTPEPQPLTYTNITQHDQIWSQDSFDPYHELCRLDDGSSPPFKHMTPEVVERIGHTFDLPHATDSLSDKSDSSQDTMIMMTTDEIQKNEDNMKKSLSEYEMKGATEYEMKGAVEYEMKGAEGYSDVPRKNDYTRQVFGEKSQSKKPMINRCSDDTTMDDGYGTDTRTSSLASAPSPLSSSMSSLVTTETESSGVFSERGFQRGLVNSAYHSTPQRPLAQRKQPQVMKKAFKSSRQTDNSLQDQLRALTTIDEEEPAADLSVTENAIDEHNAVSVTLDQATYRDRRYPADYPEVFLSAPGVTPNKAARPKVSGQQKLKLSLERTKPKRSDSDYKKIQNGKHPHLTWADSADISNGFVTDRNNCYGQSSGRWSVAGCPYSDNIIPSVYVRSQGPGGSQKGLSRTASNVEPHMLSPKAPVRYQSMRNLTCTASMPLKAMKQGMSRSQMELDNLLSGRNTPSLLEKQQKATFASSAQIIQLFQVPKRSDTPCPFSKENCSQTVSIPRPETPFINTSNMQMSPHLCTKATIKGTFIQLLAASPTKVKSPPEDTNKVPSTSKRLFQNPAQPYLNNANKFKRDRMHCNESGRNPNDANMNNNSKYNTHPQDRGVMKPELSPKYNTYPQDRGVMKQDRGVLKQELSPKRPSSLKIHPDHVRKYNPTVSLSTLV